MALIRSANAANLMRDAVVLDLGDLQRQGSAIIARAQSEAERIIAEAKAERERILDGAAEQGRTEGLARGVDQGRKLGAEQARVEALGARQQELEALIGAWREQLAAFSAQRDSFVQAAERDVIRLAVLIAEKIVKRQIAADPSVVIDQVRSVLGTVIRPTEAVLAVHPEDRPLVESALAGLLAQFPAVRNVSLVEDGRVARGSCVARMRDPETAGAGGEVDASIDEQLGRILSVLLPDSVASRSESREGA